MPGRQGPPYNGVPLFPHAPMPDSHDPSFADRASAQFRRRLRTLAVVALAGLALLTARLVYLQAWQ